MHPGKHTVLRHNGRHDVALKPSQVASNFRPAPMVTPPELPMRCEGTRQSLGLHILHYVFEWQLIERAFTFSAFAEVDDPCVTGPPHEVGGVQQGHNHIGVSSTIRIHRCQEPRPRYLARNIETTVLLPAFIASSRILRKLCCLSQVGRTTSEVGIDGSYIGSIERSLFHHVSTAKAHQGNAHRRAINCPWFIRPRAKQIGGRHQSFQCWQIAAPAH